MFLTLKMIVYIGRLCVCHISMGAVCVCVCVLGQTVVLRRLDLVGGTFFACTREQTVKKKCTVAGTALYVLGFAVAHVVVKKTQLGEMYCHMLKLPFHLGFWHVPLKHEIFLSNRISTVNQSIKRSIPKQDFSSCNLYIYRAQTPSQQCGDARTIYGCVAFQIVHINLAQKIKKEQEIL